MSLSVAGSARGNAAPGYGMGRSMKKKKVQIAIMRQDQTRWQFVAHGAAWSRDEAESMAARYEAQGCQVRLLATREKES